MAPVAMAPAPLDGARRRDRPVTPDLRGPDDPFRERRLAWAVLLRRSFGLDVLACPTCGNRMELIAAIEDPDLAAQILRHLNLPTRGPPRGPPWRAQAELALEQAPGHADYDGVDPPSPFE